MGIDIVTIGPERLEEVALLHQRAFPEAGLTVLGREAVRRYYEWQLLGPHDVVAVGASDGASGLVGFCVGGVFRGALSGFLRANRSYLVRTLLARPWLVSRAVVRDRTRRGVRAVLGTARGRGAPGLTGPSRPSFGVLAIAVDPSRARQGIGRSLLAAVEAVAVERGFDRMALTVDPADAGAVRFYERSGFARTAPSATWCGDMVKHIGAAV